MFKYNDGGRKVGFFGFDDSDNKFKFIPDATDSSSVFSGSNGTFVGTFEGNATFNGNVTIGGTLIYDDVVNVDSLGFVTARTGVHVGFDYDGGTGIGATLLPSGNAVFAGIVTAPTIRSTTITATSRLGVNTDNPLNAIQVGTAASAFTVGDKETQVDPSKLYCIVPFLTSPNTALYKTWNVAPFLTLFTVIGKKVVSVLFTVDPGYVPPNWFALL